MGQGEKPVRSPGIGIELQKRHPRRDSSHPASHVEGRHPLGSRQQWPLKYHDVRFLTAFVANRCHDFTYGSDDRVGSFYRHAVATVGHDYLASAT
jgi:hypothetical protein